MQKVKAIAERAWHFGEEYARHPAYRLYAGVAAAVSAKSAVDAGSRHGEPGLAALPALKKASGSEAVVFSITYQGDEVAAPDSQVTRIVADHLDEKVMQQVISNTSNVDVLFLDVAREPLKAFTLYSNLLNPQVIVLDGVNRTDDAREAWRILQQRFPDQTLDGPLISSSLADCGLWARA